MSSLSVEESPGAKGGSGVGDAAPSYWAASATARVAPSRRRLVTFGDALLLTRNGLRRWTAAPCDVPVAGSLTDRATSPHLCHVEPRSFVAADATLPCAPRAYDLEILARQWVPALAVRLPGVLVAHACDPFTSRPWTAVAETLSGPLLPGRPAPGSGASPVAGRPTVDLGRAGQGDTVAPTSHDAFLRWG